MLIKLPKSSGFGMQPGRVGPSPYAVGAYGSRPELSERTRLTLNLVRKDMFQMGHNLKRIDFTSEAAKLASDYTIDAFRLPTKIQPHLLDDVFDMDLELRQSSPGIPWAPMYKTRGEVMDDISCRNTMKLEWYRVANEMDIHLPDCKVLYRAHFKVDGKPKLRAVYGYPTTVTLAEAQFALPLIDSYKRGTTPLAYGYDMALGGAMRVRRDVSNYKCFACIDFKSFDKSVPSDLIKFAFRVLRMNIDFTQYSNGQQTNAIKLFRIWEKIIEYFCDTPMRFATGERYLKRSGVPSGSFFTQLIDSIVNYWVLTYASLRVYSRPPQYVKVFGDDSVMAAAQPIDIWRLGSVISELGMMINPHKSISTVNIDELEFLGFQLTSGFPHRSLEKWLQSLYYPEYPDQSWDDFASRALGLYYANHGVCPVAHQMFRDVITSVSFTVHFRRDFKRFLRGVGVEPTTMSVILPDRMQFLVQLAVG